MKISTHTTAGLGNSTVYVRLVDGANFWDFVGLSWVTPITADCKKMMTEHATSDTLLSRYEVEIDIPAGGPWALEIANNSTGGIIASGDTSAELAQTTADTLPTLSEIEASTVLAKEATAGAIKGKTDNLPASPAATGDAMTLTSAYDAAKTAASQSSVDTILSASVGSGDTAVNHDTGGADNLRYVYNGVGIDNAIVKAYLKSDWDAGNKSESYVKGITTTDVNGRWTTDLMLDTGNTYTIVFYKQGAYDESTAEVTI